MKGFLIGCGIAGLVIVLIVLSIVGMAWDWGMGVAHRVASPDAAIDSYEWYEQQIKDVKAITGQLGDAEEAVQSFKKDNGPPAVWKFDQRGEYSQLQTNVTGIRQARRTMIENYNARAAMISRNLWKSSTCPQHLDE